MVHIQEKLMCLKSGSESEDPDSDLSVPLLFPRSRSQSQECVVADDDVPGPCSNLPRELLLIIFRKLEDPSDIYNCAMVCGSWNSAMRSISPKFLLLSIVGKGDASPDRNSCTLFNPDTNTTHQIALPNLKGKWFSSSSFGWLLTIRVESPHQLSLLNPFTGHQISLPPAKDFFKDIHHYNPMEPDAYFSLYRPQQTRVITSASPLNPNCLILADHSFAHTFGNRLSFCRPGDKSWTDLDFNEDCCDTIYYHGEFYAVDYYAYIYRIHCRDIPAAEKLPLQPIEILLDYHTNYLVELDGHLLLVVRYLYNGFPEPSQFDVYKLDWLAKAWVRVKSIHHNAILLGRYSSISLPASRRGDLRANCIYYIDDFPVQSISLEPQHNSGLYDMATGTFEHIYQFAPIWTSPLNWLIPTFQLECKCKAEDNAAEEKSKSWLSKIWPPIFTHRRCLLCCWILCAGCMLCVSWILCGSWRLCATWILLATWMLSVCRLLRLIGLIELPV
ncbi:hypothetical protein LWI29_027824 [Acer saccharum]|uniref:F-box domain-containing protein n=1 Tax=Acer saccharum TaxID=4024 RepID=A0AA39W060_ACESA|nr:hypothetical protein LWI29_027824 [Acer saccharum]